MANAIKPQSARSPQSTPKSAGNLLYGLLSAALCLATGTTALAGGPPGPNWAPAAPGQGGWIWEGGGNTNQWFNVYPTGANSKVNGPAIVQAVQATVQPNGAIGALIWIPPDPTGTRFDLKNRTFSSQKAALMGGPMQSAGPSATPDDGSGNGGGVLNDSACADLDLEAEYLGTDGNIHLEDTMGRLAIQQADGINLAIPDLYTAEVTPDSNGMYTLYSWVDINEFSPSTTFVLGEDFNISNGTCPALPGMLFSTTPFDFTGSNAPSDGNPDAFAADGVTGDAFTGDAIAETLHLPEPADRKSVV